MERIETTNREAVTPEVRPVPPAELEPDDREAIRVKLLVVAVGTVLALTSMGLANAFAPVGEEAEQPAAAVSAPADEGAESAPLSASIRETKATFSTAVSPR